MILTHSNIPRLELAEGPIDSTTQPGVDLSDASEEKSQKEKNLFEFSPEDNPIQDNAIQDGPNEDCTIEESAITKQNEVSRRDLPL
jgi:hypothetical protein